MNLLNINLGNKKAIIKREKELNYMPGINANKIADSIEIKKGCD